MQAGLVARVHGDFDSISEDKYPIQRQDGLKTSLRIREQVTNQSGDSIISGVAADEVRVDEEVSEIGEDGSIKDEVATTNIETISTEFASIPGEFVVIENSNAQFALDLIGKDTESMIEAIGFNLDAVAYDYVEQKGADTWMTGFYDNEGNADTGVAYGNNVYEDQTIGPILRDGHLNQLGLTFDRGPDEVKLMITESGYFRVYSPSEYGTPSYIRLVKEFINEYGIEDDKR